MVNICHDGFLNCSQVIGQVIINTTEQTTGSIFLTFLFIMLFLVAIAMIFQIKLEYTMIILLPVLLALMSYYQQFVAIGSVILIYLAIIVTKNFILK